MEQMLFIGTKVDKASREELTNFIVEIFKAGNETEMSGKTIRHALSMFQKVIEPNHITLSGCTFTNNPEPLENVSAEV